MSDRPEVMMIREWILLGGVGLLIVAAFLTVLEHRRGNTPTPKYVHSLVSLANLIVITLLVLFEWRAEWLYWALVILSLIVAYYFHRHEKEAGPSAESGSQTLTVDGGGHGRGC